MSKQRTVKRAVEALYWIHNNAHHEVGTEFHPVTGKETHVFFRNYHERLRVPSAMAAEVFKYLKPNRSAFDTRMYALTPAGKAMVAR